jgi:PAS domain S-box-containing protein
MRYAVDDRELERLAACWIAMAQATTLDAIEAAALSCLLELTDVDIAFTARREPTVWTISEDVGLTGDVAGVAIPEAHLPYADELHAGRSVEYDDAEQMGPDLASALAAIGVGALFAVPIMRDQGCVGALAIGQPGPARFSERDRTLVRLITAHLSALVGKRDLLHSLETLAESVPAIVLRTDPTGWINWYNHRWYEFTGQTREEAAGWGWQTAHHPVDFQHVIQEWPKALATGQPIEIEFRLRRYDGEYHWHLARVEPIRDDKGAILSWYGTVVDIQAQKTALERTTRVATTLQEAFLPNRLPRRENLRIDANYVSAEEDALVGGDWYDAFELPDGRLCFSIGDVAGHGLAASLIVGKLRQAMFTLALDMDDPAAILRKVDRILRIIEPGTFVTALLGFIDAAAKTMRYASAGHPPPIVAYAPDAPAQVLALGGPPLGVMDDLELVTHEVAIEPDMVVALYTDGMTEFSHDALLGERAVRAALPKFVAASIEHPARMLYDLVVGNAVPADDAAVMLLQFSAIPEVTSTDEPLHKREWRFHASDAQAAHMARREIGSYIHRLGGDTDSTSVSELIVGELIANTVEHAPGLVHLSIEWDDEHPVFIVRDSGPGLERVQASLPADIMNEGSRGLFLVQSLSPSVTVAKSPSGGAELRAVLPITRHTTDLG